MPDPIPNNYPKPLIHFRRRSAAMPNTLNPANCNPSDLGVQLSSVTTWRMIGTPSLEFAVIGKKPQKSPTSAPTVISTDNIWSLQGCEVRVYFDHRDTADQSDAFDFWGTTTKCPLVFVGDVHEIRPAETSDNRWHAFACGARGLMSRAERVPVVSPIDNGDIVRFNMNALLSEYQPSTAGKTIGQAIQMILQTPGVAINLLKQGIGSRDRNGVQSIRFRNVAAQVIPNYVYDDNNTTTTADDGWKINLDALISGAVTAELPDLTKADLATMNLVTPFEFRISGDNVIASIQQALDAFSPNHGLVVMPSGLIRFYDMRLYDAKSFDLMAQPVDGFTYSKSTLGSYSRVIVRGGPKIVPYYCQWSAARNSNNLDDSPDSTRFNGSLIEQFNYAGATNSQAKIAYQHEDFSWGKKLLSKGWVYFQEEPVSPPTSPPTPPVDLPSNKIRIVQDTSSSGVLSANTDLRTWDENELTMIDGSSNTRRECRIVIRRETASGSNTFRVDSGEFLISANSNMTSSTGSCTITTSPNVDRPPPTVSNGYTYSYRYEIYGYPKKGSTTWRRFKVQLDDLPSTSSLKTTQSGMTRVLGTTFVVPQSGLAYSNIGGTSSSISASATRMTLNPECLVEYRERSLNTLNQLIWTYRTFWASFRIDPVNNAIIISRPVVLDSGNQPTYDPGKTGTFDDKTPPWDTNTSATLVPNQPFKIVPYNIKALLPVYEGTQEAVYPHHHANGTIYSGESESAVKNLYGIDRDLILHIPDWFDNRDQSYADKYAKEIWASVQQPQVEGGFAWVTGTPDIYLTGDFKQWDYRGLIDSLEVVAPSAEADTPVRRLQAFSITVSESCNADTGSGVEDCPLVMTATEVKYQSNRKPYTVASFSTAKPRAAIPMHDFHSFEEHLARDPNIQ